jgi:acyl-coenzyme A thioesterase PaaI-like protein
MAAIDTVASPAMFTTERAPQGTVYQHTRFLRPALDDYLKIEAKVLRFGKSSAFAECRATFASSGEIVAHASIEFAF